MVTTIADRIQDDRITRGGGDGRVVVQYDVALDGWSAGAGTRGDVTVDRDGVVVQLVIAVESDVADRNVVSEIDRSLAAAVVCWEYHVLTRHRYGVRLPVTGAVPQVVSRATGPGVGGHQ